MTVDLRQYLDQEVQVTYENGDTLIGKIGNVPKVEFSELEYCLDSGGSTYTWDGFYWSHRGSNELNIVKIKPINMKKYEQLENQIKELQAEVERLKKEEESKLPKGFSRKNAIAFLKEPNSFDLNEMCKWHNTHQNSAYWARICDSLEHTPYYKVPQEAIMAIQSWVIESYKEQYGV